MTTETRITGAIDVAHPALPGHFPGNPLVPGVVILDRVCRALAQVHDAALSVLHAVKFHAPLRPSEPFEIELAQAGGGRFRFRVLRGHTLIATGTIEAATACARPTAN